MDEFENKEISPETAEAPVETTEPIGMSEIPMPETGVAADAEAVAAAHDEDDALDKNVRLLSPGRMVARRFFRSKLSIVGLVMIISLILFSWLGPVVYRAWGEIDIDHTPSYDYYEKEIEYRGSDGEMHTMHQMQLIPKPQNTLSYPSATHILGTDQSAMDIFARLMYGGRVSLSISFLAVFAVTFLGIIFGGVAGYFGRWVDEVIMRICDILMCLPSLPIMIIVGQLLVSWEIPPQLRIYLLMLFLTFISWPGIARLVRGQILFLREQEYMVAAEAMGFSTSRKIFKHLIPNVLPQLIVSMTLSLGSMILQEATFSYLGFGVQPPYSSWGLMINAAKGNEDIIQNYFNIWGPPGICIIIAVLGFNFIGDGLRDALDPKARR